MHFYERRLTIDIGAALPYIEDRILTVFGKDQDTRDRRARLSKLLALSAEQAKPFMPTNSTVRMLPMIP
jgi:hypothetical protein